MLLNTTLDSSLKQMGFQQSVTDPCIYFKGKDSFYLGVYVDDIILIGKTERVNAVQQDEEK